MHHTRQAARANAAHDYLVKLQLEKKLEVELRSYFQELVREFKIIYAATGRIIDATEYSPELEAILRTHYRRVRQHFGFQFRKKLYKVQFVGLELKETEREDDENAVGAALLLTGGNTAGVDEQQSEYIKTRAKGQAQKINQTSNQDMDRAITAATTAALINQTSMAPSEVAADAAAKFAATTEGRLEAITATETSPPGEAMRYLEATALTGLGAVTGDGTPLARAMTKEWISILDNVTRHWHAAADGQIREFAEPFEVGGEQLLVPGDTSLGATAKNIVHCRCSSQARFKS